MFASPDNPFGKGMCFLTGSFFERCYYFGRISFLTALEYELKLYPNTAAAPRGGLTSGEAVARYNSSSSWDVSFRSPAQTPCCLAELDCFPHVATMLPSI